MSLSASSAGASSRSSVWTSTRSSRPSTIARAGSGRVLQSEPGAGAQRCVGHPADVGLELARHRRRRGRAGEHVAARDVDVVGEPDRHALRRRRLVERAVEGVDRGDRRAHAAGQHDDLGARRQHASGDLARVAAVVAGVVADDPLDGEAAGGERAVAGELDALEVLEQRRAAVPRHRGRSPRHDVVAAQRRQRDERLVGERQPLAEAGEVAHDRVEALLLVRRPGPSC